MSYQYEYSDRIRFSQCDINNQLSLTSLIDDFQDCSIFHSEDLNVGFNTLNKNNLVWMLSYWEIEITRMPVLCENVTIGTFPYGFKSFLGYRNFYMKGASGECIVKANTTWTLIDTSTSSPTKTPDYILNAYPLGEKLDMTYSNRKIQLPSEDCATIINAPERIVSIYNLDVNNHVNNCQYINFALDALGKNIPVKRLRADYRKQAVLNDTIYPVVYEEKDCYTIALNDANGSPYSVIQIS